MYIWKDSWLSSPLTYKVQSPCSVLTEDAKVCGLIDQHLGEWNMSLIELIFWAGESEIIGNLPLSRYKNLDKMVLKATKLGEFTIRSAYHLEKDRQLVQYGECSHKLEDMILWIELWRLQVPKSIQVFLWRACQNIHPTKDNLLKRVVKEVNCIFYSNNPETGVHILWDCPSTRDV